MIYHLLNTKPHFVCQNIMQVFIVLVLGVYNFGLPFFASDYDIDQKSVPDFFKLAIDSVSTGIMFV